MAKTIPRPTASATSANFSSLVISSMISPRRAEALGLVVSLQARLGKGKTAWHQFASSFVKLFEHGPALTVRANTEGKNYENASIFAANDLVEREHKKLLRVVGDGCIVRLSTRKTT